MKKIAFFSSLILFLSLVACGGSSSDSETGGSSDSSGSGAQTGLPSNLNGLIVFDRASSAASSGPATVNPAGIFKLRLNNGRVTEKRTITTGFYTGYSPYAHSSGKILFFENCGLNVNRIRMFKKNGLVNPSSLTLCSNTIETGKYKYTTAKINSARLSPDGSKIVIAIYYYTGNYDEYDYAVLVYDVASGKEIKRLQHYFNPTWHPDGRLLITPSNNYGIYLASKDFTTLRRIDDGEINMHISSPDISPSGNQVIFSMGQQIWIMDINGGNLRDLIVSNSNLSYPTWSPDEKYIAYFRYGSYAADDLLMFYELDSAKKYQLNTDTVLPPGTNGSFFGISPAGPLSWVK